MTGTSVGNDTGCNTIRYMKHSRSFMRSYCLVRTRKVCALWSLFVNSNEKWWI